MNRAIARVVAADLLFLLFLTLSGAFGGLASDVLYWLGFLIPLAVFFIARTRDGAPPVLRLLQTDRHALLRLSPLFFGVLGLIFGLAWLTELIFSPLLPHPQTTLSSSLAANILLHAALPAASEELLFRFVPLSLVAPHSKSHAVWLSALFFAVLHLNLFQIPYAFAAGLLFAAFDLACGSILPSVILHFVNNLLSVCWMTWGASPGFAVPFCVVLIALSLGSLVYLAVFFRPCAALLRFERAPLSEKERSALPILLIAVALFLAASALIP